MLNKYYLYSTVCAMCNGGHRVFKINGDMKQNIEAKSFKLNIFQNLKSETKIWQKSSGNAQMFKLNIFQNLKSETKIWQKSSGNAHIFNVTK